MSLGYSPSIIWFWELQFADLVPAIYLFHVFILESLLNFSFHFFSPLCHYFWQLFQYYFRILPLSGSVLFFYKENYIEFNIVFIYKTEVMKFKFWCMILYLSTPVFVNNSRVRIIILNMYVGPCRQDTFDFIIVTSLSFNYNQHLYQY